jgi:plastocyanin/truncated hemoglobin YjbI
MRGMRALPAVVAAVLLAACGGGTPTASTPTASAARAPAGARAGSLFVRLGREPAIEGVVGELVARLAADPRVKYRFANSDMASLTRDLADFVCVAAGGPCAYRGRAMKLLHASMHVSKAEWDATIEALVGALDRFRVGAAEKAELLGAIGPLEADIVDPPAPLEGDALAAIDRAAGDLGRYGDQAELLGAALAALRIGQRSYAEQLFSMAELAATPKALKPLAPLFRDGAPPRITTTPTQLPPDAAPQPAGAVGGSDEDAPAAKPEKASLTGTLSLNAREPKRAFGVVMLTPAGGGKRRTPKQRIIEQRGREFAPRLMAVPVGSTIAFPNFDAIYHNVFSRSDARAFDLGLFKGGQARSITFDKPGIVRVGCNLHANMSTSIIVVRAPHYAVTDADGKFRFASLRPGKYDLEAWTERSAEPVKLTIDVAAGEHHVDVDAGAEAPRGTGQDKFGAARGTSP